MVGRISRILDSIECVTWNCQKGGVGIAQWIHLCLPSCCPGFESQDHRLCFYQFKFEFCHVEKTKINRKRSRDWPIFLKCQKTFCQIWSNWQYTTDSTNLIDESSCDGRLSDSGVTQHHQLELLVGRRHRRRHLSTLAPISTRLHHRDDLASSCLASTCLASFSANNFAKLLLPSRTRTQFGV